jgi:hypothetical protein
MSDGAILFFGLASFVVVFAWYLIDAQKPARSMEEERNDPYCFGMHARATERQVGPKGGVYRITSGGRKVYLRQNGRSYPRRNGNRNI